MHFASGTITSAHTRVDRLIRAKNGSGLAAEQAFTKGDYGDQRKDVSCSESAQSRSMTGLS